MAVDKNLFLYDLAVVSMLKNEGPYLKEWLDYHILAGVDHFFIYDHNSPDNMKEILRPYVERGIVTCIFAPDKRKQVDTFNEAVQLYRFFCRYMTFIDGDEFIFPQSNKSILEVTDEIFQNKSTAGGLVINWIMYGSNNLEKADYSKGVLERFTRHANKLKDTIKTIANPRKVDYMFTPHYMVYFDGYHQLDEVSLHFFPNTNYKISDKIIMNHYFYKSHEEFQNKMARNSAAYGKNPEERLKKTFSHEESNDVYDDSILKYRNSRQKIMGEKINQINYGKIYGALVNNLAPTFQRNAPKEFFNGKMETFLTCRKLAEYLRGRILDEESGKFFEEAALRAIYKTLFTNVSIADIKLLLSEMPNILTRDYPIVKNIVEACIKILSQIKDSVRNTINDPKKMLMWRQFTEYDYLMRMLQSFKFPENKG